MAGPVKIPEELNVGSRQRTADELVHLIRKLRWMGMVDEADAMQAQLANCRPKPRANVIGEPCDTD